MTVTKIRKELRQAASKDKAKILSRFFKTGKGEYGEGDKFLGIVVPKQRAIVKKFLNEAKLDDIQSLLNSVWHEERLTGLLILVGQYRSTSSRKAKKQIYSFYLRNLLRINNWDLVDLSAPNIVGDYLFNYLGKREADQILLRLAKSKNLWPRRVAILATFTFIKNKQFAESLELAERLLIKQKDSHDLMHKAVGWMLREVGKRDKEILIAFLTEFGAQLPRTALRYSIERFSPRERQKYLRH